MPVIHPVWAVHIADGVLSWPWLLAGFLVAGLFAVIASWRLHEDDIPRIALMAAAFFVASSIHVRLGPSSVHLLLNGLVGVVLGWRAPLAILLGVGLQALLIPHGGLSTIGVNASTEMLPALAAGLLFRLLHTASGRTDWMRSSLVAGAVIVWGGCLVFGVVVLWTNPVGELVRFSPQAGLVVSVEHLRPAVAAALHPATLILLGVAAGLAALVERRLTSPPEFPLGAFLGVLSVLGTTGLTGLVLLADGAERWGTFVSIVFLAHLPLALLEGLILGCTVSFLARVKPQMLGLPIATAPPETPFALADRATTLTMLAVGMLAMAPSPVQAHRLDADHRVDRAAHRVTIESWYETGALPHAARATVLRKDGSILAEGPLDARGAFTFTYQTAEPLHVRITAPGGHRASCTIAASELGELVDAPSADPETPVSSTPAGGSRGRAVLLGLALLLTLAAIARGWLTARRQRRSARDR